MERLMKKPVKGANQSWDNDETGNKGTITISDVVQQEQKNCYHFISQFIIAKGDDKGSHKLTSKACKNQL
jgi:surface antigen